MFVKPPLLLMLVVSFFVLSIGAFGQARPEPQDTIIYLIVTDDGNSYKGTIIDRNSEYLLLETDNIGTIRLQFDHIQQMEKITSSPIQATSQSAKPSARPQETTYHFTPNGYGLKKGEGYYQNIYLFINQFYVGLTDYFTIGGGLVPIPADGMPLWVTPKLSIPLAEDKVNLGIGSINGVVLGYSSENFGAFYANLTFGSRERNFSIGAGKGYSNGLTEGMAFSVSGQYRVGQGAYLVTENYSLNGISLGSVGGRYIWPQISIEFSLLYVNDYDLFFAIPYGGVIVPFGKNKKQ